MWKSRKSDIYIHRSKQHTDTGLKLELLQEYVFIALDIFKENVHNKGVNANNRLEAWLTFLCEEEPEWILRLIEVYPEFEELYQEVYNVCRNTEDMMGLFSEELLELDKNTVEYMIDEMQDTIDEQKKLLEQKESIIKKKNNMIEERDSMLQEKNSVIEEKDAIIARLQAQLAGK